LNLTARLRSIHTADFKKDSLEDGPVSISNGEIIDLVVNEGEEGLTSFDAAMLVNMESLVGGIQTELYNSGASQHMSLHRKHFENYVSIVSKLITTTDKCYFQAIEKGNLLIKLLNGPAMTTILLKNVLHCPNMGLTLVSISKITATSYKVIFQGPTCKFFDSQDKVIGLISMRNRLYHVDHEAMVNVRMAGEVQEIIMVKQLHCQMGHIAPEAVVRFW
jgi:hypothetical protein